MYCLNLPPVVQVLQIIYKKVKASNSMFV